MKKLFKQIGEYIKNFFFEKEPVIEAVEKTPLDEKRELVGEVFGFKSEFVETGGRMGEVLEGIAKGTLVLERMAEKERISDEEIFMQSLFQDMRKLIVKHFDDETTLLRKEITSLKVEIENKDRQLEVLKNVKEVLV